MFKYLISYKASKCGSYDSAPYTGFSHSTNVEINVINAVINFLKFGPIFTFKFGWSFRPRT
jgi:hypothetical protein